MLLLMNTHFENQNLNFTKISQTIWMYTAIMSTTAAKTIQLKFIMHPNQNNCTKAQKNAQRKTIYYNKLLSINKLEKARFQEFLEHKGI